MIRKLLNGLRYAIDEIAENGSDPQWWNNRISRRINGPFQTHIWPGREGVDVPAEDWDLLIVLDACRADAFERTVETHRFDTYERRTSKASMTAEWLRVVWPDEYGDIVYVTGNPMVSLKAPDKWHILDEAWADGFDDEINQVDPKEVTERTKTALSNYPDKRVVAHYMQPHHPFIGYPDLHYGNWDGFHDLGVETEGVEGIQNVWQAGAKGLEEAEYIWQAYRDNLSLAMPHVWNLIDSLKDGTKVVVTSDHGNVIAQRSYPVPVRVSGHPRRTRLSNLIEVPWAKLTVGRRQVTDGVVGSEQKTSDDTVHERLEVLGYA